MMLEKQEWERIRTLAALLLQPYSKKKLTPADILKMDDGDMGSEVPKRSSPERMRELARKIAESL